MAAPTSSIINLFPALGNIPGPWRTKGREIQQVEKDIFSHLVREAVEASKTGMNTYVHCKEGCRRRILKELQYPCRWAGIFADAKTAEGDRRDLIKIFSVVWGLLSLTRFSNVLQKSSSGRN
jgi:hypothetical protein